ncbi:hypothetical protein JW930_07395, partial [Candidatus Woesearchaeota archaeon]|nr:hypothetical protein [Candidatus Woesearchaeota archaeon]
VLESLEKKGFVVMKLGKPIKYIAVPPEEVIERVKKQIKKDADLREVQLEELTNSKVMDELVLLHSQGVNLIDPTELTGSIRGRENIYSHLDTQIKNAKESIFIVSSKNGLIRKTKALAKQLKKAKARGVKIYLSAPKAEEALKNISAVGDVTFTPSQGPENRFCVIDNKEITFFITDDTKVHPSYDVAVWINSPYFVKSLLSQYF